MQPRPARGERRVEALSRARIVQAAIALLDDGGIEALTFRALAAGLATGPGAIYHHVANKDELLSAAASDLLRTAIDGAAADGSDGRGVREVMSRVFITVTEHPWVGRHLAAAPWQPAVLQLLDRVGSELTALGVPQTQQLDAASVLVFHLLGVAAQRGAASQLHEMTEGRAAFIAEATSHAQDLDPGQYPFLEQVGPQLAAHDDEQQFNAGVDIILAGIAAGSGTTPDRPAPDFERRSR